MRNDLANLFLLVLYNMVILLGVQNV
jgi:hypothetical protein